MARGRIRQFDRNEALAGALLVFWRKGFNATSMRDLSEALGIGLPSLYGSFGSKEALFVEVVDLYMEAARTGLWAPMKGLSAREAIETLLRLTARELSTDEHHPVGCMVTTAFVDEDMPLSVAEAIREARRAWVQVVQDRLQQAVAEGDLPPDADIASLGRFYAGVVQAVGVQAHDGASTDVLNRVVDIAMAAWPAGAGRSAPVAA